jgi:hypothetical protein
MRHDGGTKTYSGRDAEVARYITFQRHCSEASAADRRATSLHVSFFRELLRSQPDLGRVRSISLGIRNAAADAMEHYQAAVSLYGTSPALLEACAPFAGEVAMFNNPQLGSAVGSHSWAATSLCPGGLTSLWAACSACVTASAAVKAAWICDCWAPCARYLTSRAHFVLWPYACTV